MEHRHAAAHRLDLGADPLEGQRLPRRQHGHRARQGADHGTRGRRPPPVAIRQARSSPSRSASRPVAVTTRSGTRSREGGQCRGHHGLGRLGDGDGGVGRAEQRHRPPGRCAAGGERRPGCRERVCDAGWGGGTSSTRSGSEWHHSMAASMPSAAMRSTASAAVCTATARTSRTALGGRRSTWDAPWAALGGLPTPMRTRRKSDECRCDWMERSPLCPARPPPALRRTVPGREVELVVHDHDGRSDRSIPNRLASARTATPDSFM